jgi:tetratricopeptide (TPR) repeat protein
MSDEQAGHPTDEEVAGWRADQAPPAEAAALFAHLRGCAPCWQRWAGPAAAVLAGPKGAPAPPLGLDSYDFAILRALSRVEAPARRAWSLSDRSTLWALASALLECAAGERDLGHLVDAHEDAYWAAACALLIPDTGPPQALADLRCRAWLELGNLRRALNDLEGAEAALYQSQTCLDAGSQAPLLLARWLDVAGSLFRDQNRFEEAVEVLEEAAEIYLEHARRDRAARTLIKLGFTYQAWAKPGPALEVFSRAFGHLLAGPLDDLMLALTGAHNALLALVDAGEAERVWTELWSWRQIYEQIATPHLLIRLDYLDAKVSARLGHYPRSERLYRKTIKAFQGVRQVYDAAVAALDLAALLVERRRPAADVLAVLDGAVAAFVDRQIYRELFISFRLLRESVGTGRQAAEAIARFADEVQAAGARASARK